MKKEEEKKKERVVNAAAAARIVINSDINSGSFSWFIPIFGLLSLLSSGGKKLRKFALIIFSIAV